MTVENPDRALGRAEVTIEGLIKSLDALSDRVLRLERKLYYIAGGLAVLMWALNHPGTASTVLSTVAQATP